MTLDEIPNDSAILLDANVIIYAKRGLSDECRRLLLRCADRQVRGFITLIAVAELCHRRMMQEAQSMGLVASNPARALSQDSGLLGRLNRYREDVQDVLAGDLTILELTTADMLEGLRTQRQYGFLTNDSLHVAAAKRAGITLFASRDPHFDKLPGITR